MNQLILHLDSVYFSDCHFPSLYYAKPSCCGVDVIPSCCFLQYKYRSSFHQFTKCLHFAPWTKKQLLFPGDTAGPFYPSTLLTINRLFWLHVAIQKYFISYCQKQAQKSVTAFPHCQPLSPNRAHTPQPRAWPGLFPKLTSSHTNRDLGAGRSTELEAQQCTDQAKVTAQSGTYK